MWKGEYATGVFIGIQGFLTVRPPPELCGPARHIVDDTFDLCSANEAGVPYYLKSCPKGESIGTSEEYAGRPAM